MIKPLITISAFFLLLHAGVFGQTGISPEVEEIADSIALKPVFEFENMGQGYKSKQWKKYQSLKEIAVLEDYVYLISHKSSVVRCYSWLALIESTVKEEKTDLLFDLVISNLKDFAPVAVRNYDVIHGSSVSSFMLYNLPKDLFSEEQLFKLDSTLIFDESIKLSYKNELIRDLPVEERYYPIIRKYAYQGNNDALVKLAQFRKLEDKEIIIISLTSKDSEYATFKAVREFPDPDFLDPLAKAFYKRWRRSHYNFPQFRMIYQALAQYPEEKLQSRSIKKRPMH